MKYTCVYPESRKCSQLLRTLCSDVFPLFLSLLESENLSRLTYGGVQVAIFKTNQPIWKKAKSGNKWNLVQNWAFSFFEKGKIQVRGSQNRVRVGTTFSLRFASIEEKRDKGRLCTSLLEEASTRAGTRAGVHQLRQMKYNYELFSSRAAPYSFPLGEKCTIEPVTNNQPRRVTLLRNTIMTNNTVAFL